MNQALQESSFSEEQKEYLSGFFEGLRQSMQGRDPNPSPEPATVSAPPPEVVEKWFGVPVDEVTREEGFKRTGSPWEMWDKMVEFALRKRFPEGGDVFRYKFHGLFYVAPNEDSFMLRMRVPGCVLTSQQLRGVADIAQSWGRGHADVTTRGNLQIRGIGPESTLDVLMKLQESGLTSKGSGADNVRNITATPTSGLDPQEVFDVRPLAKALQHYILNQKELMSLPRKFNVSFDSGGSVSTVADTNDIALLAVRVPENRDVDAGVYFRVQLAGTTGHGDFARETELLLKPEECIAVCAAILRVYSDNGDRTNRKRARLKYLIDDWGIERFLEETEKQVAFPLRRVSSQVWTNRHPVVRHGHIGVYRQKERGMNYIGILLPVGRLTAKQMRKLADFADRYGNGELRTTVWQNVLIPDIADRDVDAVCRLIRAIGLNTDASSITAGLVACTGNVGCKYASTDTKGQGLALARYLDKRLTIDLPINIHLTGCPNSCAQHHISDIGLLGMKVQTPAGDTVEGYHVFVGGSSDQFQGIGQAVFQNVPFSELPALIEHMLRQYLAHRSAGETFTAFCTRHETKELQRLFDQN